MIWQLDGNLRTAKFENMDIWDQLQGLVYQTVNVDTYNLIKQTVNVETYNITWLHSYVLIGVMHCDGDQACLYSGFCWTIREILVKPLLQIL